MQQRGFVLGHPEEIFVEDFLCLSGQCVSQIFPQSPVRGRMLGSDCWQSFKRSAMYPWEESVPLDASLILLCLAQVYKAITGHSSFFASCSLALISRARGRNRLSIWQLRLMSRTASSTGLKSSANYQEGWQSEEAELNACTDRHGNG